MSSAIIVAASLLVHLLVAPCSSEITPIASKDSIKTKLQSLLSQHGPIRFDDSITDEMASNIYEKYITNQNIDPNKPFGFQMGTNKPFPKLNLTSSKDDRRRGLTSTGWEDSDKEATLDLHNSYRSTVASGNQEDDGTDGTYPTASDMNYLFWDDALASVAQGWSDGCYFAHNGDTSDEFYDYASSASFDYPSSGIYLGENIAAYWTSSSKIEDTYLSGRVDDWWSEYDLWHYQDYQSSSINGAGHFTQMAWADTRYLGCGFSYCDDNGWNMFYLVCNYYPGGNYIGEYPYTQGTCSADTCDDDRTVTCSDSLCSGCMDPAFTSTGSTSDASDCNDGFGTTLTFDDDDDDTDTGTGTGTGTTGNTGNTGDSDDDNVIDTAGAKSFKDNIYSCILVVFMFSVPMLI